MPIYSSEKNFCPAVKEPKCSHIKSTATPAFLVGCKESIIAFQTIKINISFQAYSSVQMNQHLEEIVKRKQEQNNFYY